MKLQDLLFCKRLAELCKRYDDVHGIYPESRLEGEAVLQFICNELGLTDELIEQDDQIPSGELCQES